MSGIIAGSQLSDTAFAIASIFWKTSSLSKPTISLVSSSIPKIIFPPVPFAKATTDFIYLMLFSGRFSLNSTFFDSPERISSMVIVYTSLSMAAFAALTLFLLICYCLHAIPLSIVCNIFINSQAKQFFYLNANFNLSQKNTGYSSKTLNIASCFLFSLLTILSGGIFSSSNIQMNVRYHKHFHSLPPVISAPHSNSPVSPSAP